MRSISIDTRTLKQGDIFIPVKGQKYDGRQFINEALKKGATVLDVNLENYAKKYRKMLKCPVIAITGSAGKTTIKDMLTAIFKSKLEVVSTYENQNNEIGAPLTLVQADDRTEMVLIECGMRKKGDLKRLARTICPTHVIFTNIGLSHRQYFNSQKEIALGKAELLQKPLKWQQQKRTAFVNFGSPFHDLLAKKARSAQYDVVALAENDAVGMAQNISICFTVARYFGFSNIEIQAGLEAFETSSNRLKKREAHGAVIIDDTYNSNPDGLKFALHALSKQDGRKIAIIGDMRELGPIEEQEHQRILAVCEEFGIDMCIGYGDAMKAIEPKEYQYYHFESKDSLIKFVECERKPGDKILIKGSRDLQMETIVEALACNH